MRELLARASITEVWRALGGGELRHGRGRAFWRDGDGFNISVNSAKNVYFDHAAGSGGGVLDLIESVLSCDRRTALAWLAHFYGVSLDRPLGLAERRAFVQRRERARRAAEDLAAWWRDRRAAIIERHNDCVDTDAAVCRLALPALRGQTSLSEGEWTFLFEYSALLMTEAQQLNLERDWMESASTRELLAMRRAA